MKAERLFRKYKVWGSAREKRSRIRDPMGSADELQREKTKGGVVPGSACVARGDAASACRYKLASRPVPVTVAKSMAEMAG